MSDLDRIVELWNQRVVQGMSARPRGHLPARASGRQLSFVADCRRAQGELYAPGWIAVEGVDWAVVQTIVGRERRVAFDLRGSGFRAYTPLKRHEALRARVASSHRRERRVVVTAAFPGYVFVGARELRGVARGMHDYVLDVVRFDGAPARLPGKLIAAINQRECEGGFDQVGRPVAPPSRGEPVVWVKRKADAPFRVGDRVRINSGAFAGLEAIVAALPNDLRVELELSLFGRQTKTTVAACELD